MKRVSLSIALILAFIQFSIAQYIPEGFNYQAVVRNTNGDLVTNTQVTLEIVLKEGSSNGTAIFAEKHTKTTNAQGIVQLILGQGNVTQGNFSNIDWSSAAKYISIAVDIDGNNVFTDLGSSQLLSVPYALYAKNAGNGGSGTTYTAGSGININGNTISATDASTTNELQTLSIAGDQISISNGNTITLPPNSGTDAQTLSLSGSQLTISNGNTVTLPTGTTYTAGSGINIAGNTIIATDNSATNEIQSLTLTGAQLAISGSNAVTLPTGTTYTAGSGININGNTISATDNSTTNEIQSLTLVGSQLAISGSNAVNLPTGTTYTAGSGININGNTISATDNSATNEIQSLTLVGSQLAISGSNAVNLPTGTTYSAGTGITISNNFINSLWTASSSNIYNNNAGYTGIGTSNPLTKLDVMTNQFIDNKGIIQATYNGSGQTDQIAVSGQSTPADNYGIGGSFRGGWVGVEGYVTATGNQTYRGVYGSVTGTGLNSYGVSGLASGNGNNFGISGEANGSGANRAVVAEAYNGFINIGVDAMAYDNSSNNCIGVSAEATGNFINIGISPHAGSGSGTGYAILTQTDDEDDYAARLDGRVWIYNQSTSFSNLESEYTGSSASLAGIYSYSTTNNGTGLIGEADNGTNSWGVFGTSANGYAGYFSGDVYVQGPLSAAVKNFKIDNPANPENEILYHHCVESDQMLNIYSGNVITDENGDALVTMPDYFEALNMEFRYQLTCIGDFAQAIIKEKIRENQFRIKTDKPNIEVSWMVSGVRHDAAALYYAKPNVVEKTADEKGKYLNPEAFGYGVEMNVEPKLLAHQQNAAKSRLEHEKETLEITTLQNKLAAMKEDRKMAKERDKKRGGN
jgi:hypothetical protein